MVGVFAPTINNSMETHEYTSWEVIKIYLKLSWFIWKTKRKDLKKLNKMGSLAKKKIRKLDYPRNMKKVILITKAFNRWAVWHGKKHQERMMEVDRFLGWVGLKNFLKITDFWE